MNFKSMADMRRENDKKKNKNPKKTESYTGGEKSGLAVENNADDDISSLVAQAKQNSQSNRPVPSNPSQKGGTRPQRPRDHSVGRRLHSVYQSRRAKALQGAAQRQVYGRAETGCCSHRNPQQFERQRTLGEPGRQARTVFP